MKDSTISSPPYRYLRGYALDPTVSTNSSATDVRELVYRVAWEALKPSVDPTRFSDPVGEYVEIIDFDPKTGRCYDPVDFDSPHFLAQRGHAPSVSNPQFHQQLVYAVIMTTIKNFEDALGRKVQWAERVTFPKQDGTSERQRVRFEFVPRLQVSPHALSEANAHYDPVKKELLFGYSSQARTDAGLQIPGATVFACLSHDVVAHETTLAILDGLRRFHGEGTHPDTQAFHMAIAEIVALFQHFTFPEVLRNQIARTPNDLLQGHVLGQLAQQFGQSTVGHGDLRDGIGRYDVDGSWQPHEPDPALYANEFDSRIRAGILVATVFDAFLDVYRTRTRRVNRIATRGTGVLPEGEMLPELAEQMAIIAANTARDVLRICIRALDYCPPMDITFGDYLRAIVTADMDIVTEDTQGFRTAFVEAFQRHGISAAEVTSMAVEDLAYEQWPGILSPYQAQRFGMFLRRVKDQIGFTTDREHIYDQTNNLMRRAYDLLESKFIESDIDGGFSKLSGLMFPDGAAAAESLGLEFAHVTTRTAAYAMGNLWLSSRITPDHRIVNHVIVTLIQKRGVRFNVEGTDVNVDVQAFFVPDQTPMEDRGEHIVFRGGCTLVFDLDTVQLRYAIKKDIDDRERMVRQYKHESGMLVSDAPLFSNADHETAKDANEERIFDIFLSHNSKDKPAVRELTKLLQERGFRPWLDELHLTPGVPWKRELVQSVEACHSIGVLVGNSGFGPWELEEARIALDEAVRINKPLIPIILPGAAELNENELPPEWRMLTQRTCVSFASGFHRDAVTRLCQGIEKAMLRNSLREAGEALKVYWLDDST